MASGSVSRKFGSVSVLFGSVFMVSGFVSVRVMVELAVLAVEVISEVLVKSSGVVGVVSETWSADIAGFSSDFDAVAEELVVSNGVNVLSKGIVASVVLVVVDVLAAEDSVVVEVDLTVVVVESGRF